MTCPECEYKHHHVWENLSQTQPFPEMVCVICGRIEEFLAYAEWCDTGRTTHNVSQPFKTTSTKNVTHPRDIFKSDCPRCKGTGRVEERK